MYFSFDTKTMNRGSSIIMRSTFHHFSATLSSSSGMLWVGVMGVKPQDQSEMAERPWGREVNKSSRGGP